MPSYGYAGWYVKVAGVRKSTRRETEAYRESLGTKLETPGCQEKLLNVEPYVPVPQTDTGVRVSMH